MLIHTSLIILWLSALRPCVSHCHCVMAVILVVPWSIWGAPRPWHHHSPHHNPLHDKCRCDSAKNRRGQGSWHVSHWLFSLHLLSPLRYTSSSSNKLYKTYAFCSSRVCHYHLSLQPDLQSSFKCGCQLPAGQGENPAVPNQQSSLAGCVRPPRMKQILMRPWQFILFITESAACSSLLHLLDSTLGIGNSAWAEGAITLKNSIFEAEDAIELTKILSQKKMTESSARIFSFARIQVITAEMTPHPFCH